MIRGGLAIGVLALSAAACQGSYQWFRPRVGVTGEAPDGTPAGEYDLWQARERIGELRAWSNGGSPRPGGTSLHVGLELENLGREALALDPAIELADVRTANGSVRDHALPDRRRGAPSALRFDRALVEAWFELDEVTPWEIESFAIRWIVRAPDGSVQRGETLFRPDLRARLSNAIARATMDSDDGGD